MDIAIPIDGLDLTGELSVPAGAGGVVLLQHRIH